MTGPEHDPEFEAFLKRRSPIHRRLADFDHAEPSIELDRLVLGRAREAIETPAQPPMFRATRWAMPVGLAATILIAFTVVLNIDRHAPRMEKSVAAAKAEHAAAPVTQLTANQAERGATDSRIAAESSATPSAQAQRASAGAGAVAADAGQPASALERRDMRAERKAAAPIATATAANATATEAESDAVASDVGKQRDRSLSDQPLLASSAAVRGTTDLAAVSPAPTAAPPPASASAQTPSSASASTPPSASAPSAPPAYQASAESWLREINRLRASGKTAEAERELTAFRQAYPSHPGYSLARPPTR